jgi:separase
MANGINMRREFQNCLKIKTHSIFPGRAPSDTDWPLTEEEQQTRYGRFMPMNHTPEWLDAHLEHLSDLYRVEHELDDSEFQEKFVDILPVHWTVCSLTVDPIHNDLYAVQLRANETPFVIKLPMNRVTNDLSKYKDASVELKEIIQGSDETIHNSQKCSQRGEIEAWWAKRKELDGRLKQLLENMEQNWFSGFKVK